MAVQDRRGRDERGQGLPVLIVVLVVVVIAVVMLTRTFQNARAINDKANRIATTGRGINSSTDAIIQLTATNNFGKSILNTAQPLQGQLDKVVGLAGSIDHSAISINNSGQAINGTAHAINSTGSAINGEAHGINGALGAIQPIADSIKAGVAKINQNVDGTIGIARQIAADTGPINQAVGTTSKEAACIDQELLGQASAQCA
jgi:methyl-accepting chemotaxis protein